MSGGVCWVCDAPVVGRALRVGAMRATEAHVIHPHCLGEIDLDLLRAEGTGRDATHDASRPVRALVAGDSSP